MRFGTIDVDALARNWWVFLLRGLAAIVFAVLTFFFPGVSLAALVLLFAAWAFVDGVLAIATALLRPSRVDRWWVVVLEGIAGVVVGVLGFLWPGITAVALVYLIAAWAFVTGALEIGAAVRLRRILTGEWLLVLGGLLSIALGVLLALFPGAGALAVVLWIGAYALVAGVVWVALAIKLRAWGRSHGPEPRPAYGTV